LPRFFRENIANGVLYDDFRRIVCVVYIQSESKAKALVNKPFFLLRIPGKVLGVIMKRPLFFLGYLPRFWALF
jgi:hypothetical protein